MDDMTTVVGKQIVDFVNKETGEKIKGISLFVIRPDENVQGQKAVKVFINPDQNAYNDALALDVTVPVQCEFIYKYSVGQTKPQLVGIKAL